MKISRAQNIDFLIVLFIIGSCTFFVYSNTFSVPFQFDDTVCIQGNYVIRHIEKLRDLFFYWPTRFITYFTFAINYKIHGLNVVGYHIFNLLIHTGCGFLVWAIARFLKEIDKKDNYGISLIPVFAALIFTMHPVQTQAVTYIYQRHTCLATFFILSAFLCWIKAAIKENYSSFWFTLSFLLSVSGMFTKEISIVIPFIIAIHFFWFRNNLKVEIKTSKVLSWCAFLFVLFVSIVLMTHSINPSEIKQVNSMKGNPEHVITQKDYFLTQGHSFFIYLKLCFLPTKQNIDYDIPISKSIFSPPETFVGFTLMISIFILALYFFKKNKITSFAMIFFIISIIPQSSIIPKPDLIVEHRLYLAVTGFAIFFPFILYQVSKQKKMVFIVFLSVLLIFYGILTYQRNNLWRDPLKLWNDAVMKSPEKARPYLNRGLAHVQKGNIENALTDYTTAINLNPWYIEAYNNRGIAFLIKKNLDDAIIDFSRAIEMDPKNGQLYNYRAIAYILKSSREFAKKDAMIAVKLGYSIDPVLKSMLEKSGNN